MSLAGSLWSEQFTYSSHDEMAQNHLGPIKVEEVHKFGGFALLEGIVVDPLRLVVELDLDRQDFDAFYSPTGGVSKTATKEQCSVGNSRKKGSGAGGAYATFFDA